MKIYGEYRTPVYLRLYPLSKITLGLAVIFTICLVIDIIIARKNEKKFSKTKIVAVVLLYIIWISMIIFLNRPGDVIVEI